MSQNADRTEHTGADVAEVSDSLGCLLAAYAAILEKVSNEPFARVRRRPTEPGTRGSADSTLVKDRGPSRSLASALLRPFRSIRAWWWGFSIRPIVRFFVETHIYAKTAEMGRLLKQKRLQMTGEASDGTRSLEESIRLIGYAESAVGGWSRILEPLRFAPAVGMVLSWGVVGISDLRLGQMILLTLALVPLLMLVVYPLAVRFGFRWKRAFFMAYPFDPGEAVDRTSKPEGWKSASVYDMENLTYKSMGLRKHSETPIDLFLHPAPYWLLTSTVAALFALRQLGSATESGLVWTLIVNALLPLLFLVPTWIMVRRYRQRKTAGLT
jgi:hypothetical protein